MHLFFILLLTAYTSHILPTNMLPAYLIFSGIFLISTLFSLNTILKFRTGVFYYLLNLMFLLGFWFKFSLQKITSLSYREPIGTFILGPEAEMRVLGVVICGMAGYLLSQVCSYYLFKKYQNTHEADERHSFQKKPLVVLLFLAILLAFLNLKFNILLFALKPSVILPLKGNAIYFLALTRGIIFLFFYYCFRTYSNKILFLGALIASICSIGVLSRIVVITFFAVPFILILQNMAIWKFKKTAINILLTMLTFSLFSYATVLISTGLRNIYISESSKPKSEILKTIAVAIKKDDNIKSNSEPAVQPKYFNIKQEAQTYKELALGRWIGMEGVMATDSYPKKSFAFLWDALKEGSYHGISFYTKISNPEFSSAPNASQVTSTSVPGPIAFFYYSGSLFFVFFATLISTFLFSAVELLAFKFFNKSQAVGVFISTFMVFDFFQFGISPLSFVRYWSFSLFSIAVFYYFFVSKRYQQTTRSGTGNKKT